MPLSTLDKVIVVGGSLFLVVVILTSGYLIAHPPKPAQRPAVVVFPS